MGILILKSDWKAFSSFIMKNLILEIWFKFLKAWSTDNLSLINWVNKQALYTALKQASFCNTCANSICPPAWEDDPSPTPWEPIDAIDFWSSAKPWVRGGSSVDYVWYVVLRVQFTVQRFASFTKDKQNVLKHFITHRKWSNLKPYVVTSLKKDLAFLRYLKKDVQRIDLGLSC